MKNLWKNLKLAWSVVTGKGVDSLVIDWINDLLRRIREPARAAAIATAAAQVAGAVGNLASLVRRESLSLAIRDTADLVQAVSQAISDCEMTAEEGGTVSGAVRRCVASWRACRERKA